jgi:bifunctional non-homologous end joining protein LigD
VANLAEYRRKRKFEATPEPRGKEKGTDANRFVVQEHHARRLHFDLRLEVGGVMKSWAVPKGPSLNPADKRLAIQTEDHPLEYRTFEGVIPAGQYGAGVMKIWDAGTFEAEGAMPAAAQIERGELKFILHGRKLRGSFVLVKLHGSRGDKNEWLLIKHKDEAADPNWTLEQVVEGAAQEGAAKERATKEGDRRAAGREPQASSDGKRGAGAAAGKLAEAAAMAAAKQRSEEVKRAAAAKISIPNGAKRAAMPERIHPALATLTDKPFSGPDWLFEIKWDGIRTLAWVRDGESRMWSRSNREITGEYPELANLARSVQAREAWLDGEIVVLDETGRSDFQKIQMRFSVQKPSAQLIAQAPAVYYIFDVLYFDGYDLRRAPLFVRKNLLRQILREDARVRFSDHVIEQGRQLYDLAVQKKLEGLVAKRIASAYPEGRTQAWLKIKLTRDLDAVVGGWTDPRGSREHFGALQLGLYDGDKLEYIGGVGTGFNEQDQKLIWEQLQRVKSEASPFAARPATREKAHWVRPELVARVKFTEWTDERHLRAPRFLGLQHDRDARACTFDDEAAPEVKAPQSGAVPEAEEGDGEARERAAARKTVRGTRAAKNPPAEKTSPEEQVARDNVAQTPVKHAARRPANIGEPELTSDRQIEEELAGGSAQNVTIEIDGRQLRLTNLNKIYFPEEKYMKRDLLAYYFGVARYILPFLKDRPLVLRRYPNGISGEAFFQKDAAKETPEWIETVTIESENKNKPIRYIVASDRATLIYLTNLGCIDHNPWSSRYDDQEHPDYIFFDLDPTEGTPFATVTKLGRLLLEALEKFDLQAFTKTSGASGIHIFLPVDPRYTYEQARLLVEAIASIVGQKNPGLITSERTVARRPKGSVYVDAHQNSRGQSLASVYSARAFPHAPVSAPIKPGELGKELRPEKWNIKSMLARIEKMGDLWASFWKQRQSLDVLLKYSA